MDDSVGSSSSSSSSGGYQAHLDSLHVNIPCKTASDALLASLSVALSDDVNSNVLDALLEVFQRPEFCSKDVTFKSTQDISRHISEQRKAIAQRRSSSDRPSARKNLPYGSQTKNVYGGVPQLIVDLVAQQLASEMVPLSVQIDWDTVICSMCDEIDPRERDLLNMALVHRTWTIPATRALRPRVKVIGSKDLQAFLRSPRMGPWLRDIYFIESLEKENADEMVRLLTHLVRNAPNLRQLCIRTWWRIGPSMPTKENAFEQVVRELADKHQLEALWLFPNRGQVACLPTLVKVLPHLCSLKKLYLRNWTNGAAEEDMALAANLQQLVSSSGSTARLTSLFFVDGGLNETSAIFLPWLLRDCPLTNLEIHTKDICRKENGEESPVFHSLRPFLHKIRTLRMHYSSLNEDKAARAEFLLACSSLKTLSLIVNLYHELNQIPESIEMLHVHYSTIWPVSGRNLHDVLAAQESLGKLKEVKLTKDPIDVLVEAGMIGEEERQEASWQIDDVKQLCEGRNIPLTSEYGFVSFDELTDM